jgi:hypothetical protein
MSAEILEGYPVARPLVRLIVPPEVKIRDQNPEVDADGKVVLTHFPPGQPVHLDAILDGILLRLRKTPPIPPGPARSHLTVVNADQESRWIAALSEAERSFDASLDQLRELSSRTSDRETCRLMTAAQDRAIAELQQRQQQLRTALPSYNTIDIIEPDDRERIEYVAGFQTADAVKKCLKRDLQEGRLKIEEYAEAVRKLAGKSFTSFIYPMLCDTYQFSK